MEGLSRFLLLHREWKDRPQDWDAGCLSSAEKKRALSMRHGERRDQFLAGRWALRQLLTVRGGRPQDWSLNAEGKPVATHRRAWLAPALSLAHSGPWVLAGLSYAGGLGLDLERLGQKRPWRALAEFHSLKKPFQKTERGFLEFWTCYEAAFKAGARLPQRAWRLRGAGFVAAILLEGSEAPILRTLGPSLGAPVLSRET